jgi:hypothetical protein
MYGGFIFEWVGSAIKLPIKFISENKRDILEIPMNTPA